MLRKPLFSGQLYLSEEEFQFYCVSIDDEFWKSKNIRETYFNLFREKIENAIKDSFGIFLKDNYSQSELLQILANDLNAGERKNIERFLIENEKEFNEHLKNIFQENFYIQSGFITELSGKTPYDISFDLIDTPTIQNLLNGFAERLLIIQKKGDLMNYLLSREIIEIDEKDNYFTVSIKEAQKININIDFEEMGKFVVENT